MANNNTDIADINIALDRDVFMRGLLRHLSGALENIIGLDEAAGFISIVGQNIGEELNSEYRQALQVAALNQSQVSEVLVDLKRRIQGEFSVINEDKDKITLRAKSCPFAEKVIGRPSLCMMTSNVFGTIAAENLGYAKVELNETIAGGAPECLITVHLTVNDSSAAAAGEEYYRS